MKGPCPLAPAFWHEDDEEDDDEERKPRATEGAGDRARRAIGPAKRAEATWADYDVQAQADAVAEAHRRISPWLEQEGQIPVPSETAGRYTRTQVYLALALEAALTLGAAALLRRGFGSSTKALGTLEARSSGLLKRASQMRGKGVAGMGFHTNWSQYIATLSGANP